MWFCFCFFRKKTVNQWWDTDVIDSCVWHYVCTLEFPKSLSVVFLFNHKESNTVKNLDIVLTVIGESCHLSECNMYTWVNILAAITPTAALVRNPVGMPALLNLSSCHSGRQWVSYFRMDFFLPPATGPLFEISVLFTFPWMSNIAPLLSHIPEGAGFSNW